MKDTFKNEELFNEERLIFQCYAEWTHEDATDNKLPWYEKLIARHIKLKDHKLKELVETKLECVTALTKNEYLKTQLKALSDDYMTLMESKKHLVLERENKRLLEENQKLKQEINEFKRL